MTFRYLNSLFAAALLLTFSGAAAQTGAAATASDTAGETDTRENLEQLVETLKDPVARDALIADLELMLEAQQPGQQDREAPTGNTFDLVKEVVTDFWNDLTAVDPQQLAISSMLTVGIIVAALLLRWLLLVLMRRIYARLTRPADDAEAHADADQAPAEGVVRTDSPETRIESTGDAATEPELPGSLARLLNLIIGVLAVAFIAEVWGGGLSELLRTEIGSSIAETAVAVGLLLVVTIALWHAAGILVERLVRLGARRLDQDRTARRLNTLVPLLTKVLQATIGIMSGLLILSELGINIGPLLAGAGILGLAVGFGAQTLVKDLITGVTILLEDSATVGDVIEVGGHSGVVEEMRIRIIQLRDLRGNVHTVPYSEVATMMNFTKDFSFYLFEVGVAYREDTDEVCKVLTAISEEMQDEEGWRDNILEPLEILGVDRFADSAVIVRARLKTVPGKQWQTGREFNRRIKKRFDEAGIEIPFPHTTVYFGEPKEGPAPPMQLAFADGDGPQRLEAQSGGDNGESAHARNRDNEDED